MGKNKIKYYPVGNGDTSLITLQDDTTIMIDCNLRGGITDSDGNSIYPVKEDLIKSIRKRNNNPYVDLFVLSHPDEDHCRGFRNNFYQGDPDDYGKTNRDNEEVIIDEIWVTSMLFRLDLCNDASAIRNEVNRRKRLSGAESEKRGNRLRLIGYDANDKFVGVSQYVPGDEITMINDVYYSCFSFFIHAPFKQGLIDANANADRNSSSIVLQARFKDKALDADHSSYAIFGGDADHYIWEKILEITEGNGNGKYLKWDLFLAPHHCSWSYFNDVPYSNPNNQKAQSYSKRILSDYRESGGSIICSSKKVKNAKPNPPHQAAKDEYLDHLDSEKNDFFELALMPSESAPEPIEFFMSSSGAQKSTEKAKVAITSGGGIGAASTVVKSGENK